MARIRKAVVAALGAAGAALVGSIVNSIKANGKMPTVGDFGAAVGAAVVAGVVVGWAAWRVPNALARK